MWGRGALPLSFPSPAPFPPWLRCFLEEASKGFVVVVFLSEDPQMFENVLGLFAMFPVCVIFWRETVTYQFLPSMRRLHCGVSLIHLSLLGSKCHVSGLASTLVWFQLTLSYP